MQPPAKLRIYHIVHVDRLASIIADGALFSDAIVQSRPRPGTTIGMSEIKRRRLTNPVKCRSGLSVGECVPFYFCPRSVMLYLIYMANHPELDYRGGQNSIVHLEAGLHEVVAWAEQQERRWAFTSSNAGSSYFEDYCDLERLDEIDWDAVNTASWSHCKEEKQAEFLIERSLPWSLFRRVGVRSKKIRKQTLGAIQASAHQPAVKIKPKWYY